MNPQYAFVLGLMSGLLIGFVVWGIFLGIPPTKKAYEHVNRKYLNERRIRLRLMKMLSKVEAKAYSMRRIAPCPTCGSQPIWSYRFRQWYWKGPDRMFSGYLRWRR